MAKFQYIALDGAGQEQRGTIEAGDRAAAIAAIRASGLFPSAIGEVKGGSSSGPAGKKGAKAAKVEILGVFRVGLHNDLELEVPLQTVGVLAVASILWAAAGFHICNTPRFRSEHAQKCVRVESTRTALNADGLFDNAAVLAPVALERHDYVLKEHENLSLAERPTRAGNGPAPR